jgi:hypothetical protein
MWILTLQPGDSLDKLKEFINGNPIDTSFMDNGWEDRVDDGSPKARAERTRSELWYLAVAALGVSQGKLMSDKYFDEVLAKFGSWASEGEAMEILVVSHGSFLAALDEVGS